MKPRLLGLVARAGVLLGLVLLLAPRAAHAQAPVAPAPAAAPAATAAGVTPTTTTTALRPHLFQRRAQAGQRQGRFRAWRRARQQARGQ